MNEIKDTIDSVKDSINKRIEEKLPESTMRDVQQKLRKKTDLNRKVEDLTGRVSKMEKSMSKILANQENQTQLLHQLVATQTSTLVQIDDNKKGEKNVHMQISKVLIPSITLPKPPISKGKEKLDSIDLIKLVATELQVKEKSKQIDQKIAQVFGPIVSKGNSIELDPNTQETGKPPTSTQKE